MNPTDMQGIPDEVLEVAMEDFKEKNYWKKKRLTYNEESQLYED